MAKGDIIVGLDIGTTKICTVIGEATGKDGGEVDILGVGLSPSHGIRRGVVVDIASTVQAIEDSVKKAQRVAGVDVEGVIVGVTGEHIASLNSRGVVAVTRIDHEVTDEDVERVLANARNIVIPPDREIIHTIPRGYAIDGQSGIQTPVGMSGTRLEVETHVVTAATTFLRNVYKCVEQAGLQVHDAVLEPIATGESVLSATERELGVVLVDIGGGTSDLAIFHDGEICYSAIIPIGGNYVSSDVSAGLRTTLEEAERVKLEYGSAMVDLVSDTDTFLFHRLGSIDQTSLPVRVLAEIIEPRMHELLQMVRAEVNRSNYDALVPAGLVLSGGGALLQGATELAADITGLPTRIGVPGGVGGRAETVVEPSFATAVGLVQFAAKQQRGLPQNDGTGGFFSAVMGWMRGVLKNIRP